MIWFSIGSSSAVRSCRSDGCNGGAITCVVWLLTTVVISGYVLCMPVYVCIGLLVMCGTLACVYSSNGAGVTQWRSYVGVSRGLCPGGKISI